MLRTLSVPGAAAPWSGTVIGDELRNVVVAAEEA
jgi:hypothetical protein